MALVIFLSIFCKLEKSILQKLTCARVAMLYESNLRMFISLQIQYSRCVVGIYLPLDGEVADNQWYIQQLSNRYTNCFVNTDSPPSHPRQRLVFVYDSLLVYYFWISLFDSRQSSKYGEKYVRWNHPPKIRKIVNFPHTKYWSVSKPAHGQKTRAVA